jgi:hypothetical protein
MEKWYDVADVYRDKELRDTLASYRNRIAHSHARYARTLQMPSVKAGRPQLVTVLTEAGVRSLYLDNEMPNIAPYPVPIRFTDAARAHIIEGSLFTTQGLEEPPRTMSREAFLDFVQYCDAAQDLYEPDFIPL